MPVLRTKRGNKDCHFKGAGHLDGAKALMPLATTEWHELLGTRNGILR